METTLLTPERPATWRRVLQRTWNTMPILLVYLCIRHVGRYPEHRMLVLSYVVSVGIILLVTALWFYLAETFVIRRRE